MVAKKPVKKTTKKVPAKKAAPRKKAAAKKSSKQLVMNSFRIYKDPIPFRTFRITRQTIYWSLLLLVILFMQLWILKIQIEIADLANTLLTQEY